MIPEKLRREEINFVLLERNGKRPFEKEWQNKNINFNDKSLLGHISSGGNYGVIGGGKLNLIIIDFDDEEVQKKVLESLPDTFKVKTGSGKIHAYFFSDISESFKIFDEQMNTLVDVQGKGKQVVGPGSIHPNGNKYELLDDVDINFIHLSELKAILYPYDKKPKKESIDEKEKQHIVEDSFLDKVKATISMKYLLNYIGVDTSKNPTECPFHSSKGGKCLGFNEVTSHCFHCDGSWNIFSLVKDFKKCNFKTALEYLIKIGGIEEEYELNKKRYMDKYNREAGKVYAPKGQAELFSQMQPIFYDKSGNWWLWDKQNLKWELSDEVDVLNVVEESTGMDIITPKERTIILNSLKQEGRKKIPKDIKPTWVQFKDKIVDVKTGETFNASPEYFVTNPIPYKLHEERYEKTPTIDKIFKEWVGEEHIKTLYEILSYCLIPDYPLHRLFCFIGGGMNGKTCFIRLIGKFVGRDNLTATELDTLLSSRFEITKLHKKLVCVMGETNFNELNKTSIIKKLTGQDMIGFEYKNKTPFNDWNYAKIIIATNNLPTTSDKTIGFYRRWLIIDFPNQFSEQKDILSDIPEEEYEALAGKCIIILKDLLERRSFTNEGSIEERSKRYEDRSNPLQKFIKLFTEEDFSSYIWKYDFEKKFNQWCKENRFREHSDVAIGRKMKELNIEQQSRTASWVNDGKGGILRSWVGIKWKN